MAVYFNELTLDSVPQQNLMLLREFRRVWAQFARASDGAIKRLIVNDQGMEGLSEAVFTGADPEMLQFIFSVFAEKFRDKPEDEFTEVANDHFKGAEYHIQLKSGEIVECQTMGWAVLNRSVTLGLASTPFWRKLHYEIEEAVSFRLRSAQRRERPPAVGVAHAVLHGLASRPARGS